MYLASPTSLPSLAARKRSNVPYTIEQKGYTLLDLMLGYRVNEHLDAQLNLNNVFDKTYYQSISTNTGSGVNFYGPPRNLMLTLNYHL